jgi:hypothetical protein
MNLTFQPSVKTSTQPLTSETATRKRNCITTIKGSSIGLGSIRLRTRRRRTRAPRGALMQVGPSYSGKGEPQKKEARDQCSFSLLRARHFRPRNNNNQLPRDSGSVLASSHFFPGAHTRSRRIAMRRSVYRHGI